jgi:hypothetical protein
MFERLRKVFGGAADAQGYDKPEANRSPKVFLDGAYRLHHTDDVARFTELACEAFPEVADRITCFAADWMGNQFATDEARVVNGEHQILLLEPGTGEVLQIPAGLDTFHHDLLLREPDATACHGTFKEWLKAGRKPPTYEQCIGYQRPLFVGGVDDMDNLEVSDFEVYWSICGQLRAQIRDLPVGTKIGAVTIDD